MTRTLINRADIERIVPGPRLIGCYTVGEPGPLVLAVGAIHGNEPSGPKAIKAVSDSLLQSKLPIQGAFVGLLGNIEAVARSLRYIDEDLNRCFKKDRVSELSGASPSTSEEKELKELVETIERLSGHYEDVCFIDCHTTSSETIPYISANAHPESLHLAYQFPLHSVIGLEDSIPGCFAEYCNEFDYRGFTFEAGQHDDLSSVESQEAAIWLLLVASGALEKADVKSFQHHEQFLARHVAFEGKRPFRLVAHYRIAPDEQFEMLPGFVNFGKISKGQPLACNRFGHILSPCDGRILMPLYQKQGDDGFFVLEEEL